MLTQSAGFADLEQSTLLALGQARLHHKQPFDLDQLVAFYGHAFSQNPNGDFRADLPEEALQIALGTEAEAAADRFFRQLATYNDLSRSGTDALWTAVSGYYAAFFAANALMLVCGRGLLRVKKSTTLVMPAALYQADVQPSATTGHLALVLRTLSSSGSHQLTWRTLKSLLEAAAKTQGNGPREAAGFAALAALLDTPGWLSTHRNDINYDFKRNPFLAEFWGRELIHLTDESTLEARILSVVGPRPEQRFELVLTGCASLFGGLFRAFLARGGKADPQRRRRRVAAIAPYPGLGWLVV